MRGIISLRRCDDIYYGKLRLAEMAKLSICDIVNALVNLHTYVYAFQNLSEVRV